MNNMISAPRAECCPRCRRSTNPQTRVTNTNTHCITEAHYVCPQCALRFKIGILSKVEHPTETPNE